MLLQNILTDRNGVEMLIYSFHCLEACQQSLATRQFIVCITGGQLDVQLPGAARPPSGAVAEVCDLESGKKDVQDN